MERVTCSFCGLPFSVRRVEPEAEYFCCSGCALASRIPLGTGGQFPVSAGLVVALAFAFGLFNQVLFGVLGAAVVADGRAEVGERLQAVSLVLGGALALAGACFALLSRGRGWGDGIVAGLVLAAGAWLAWIGWRVSVPLAVWPLFGVDTVLAAWLARGWLWRALAKRRSANGSSDLTDPGR